MLSGKIKAPELHTTVLKIIYNVGRVLFIGVCAMIINSCGDNEKPADDPENSFNLNDPEFAINQTKKLLGDDVKFAYTGKFTEDTSAEVSAGTEIENKDEWGIKFFLLKQNDRRLVKEYESPLLEGSFTKCLVKKIKFPSFNYELIYYNSQDYFLGSGGGEIFAYIVDYKNKQNYYAHLFNEPGDPVSLYLSENIKSSDVKDFFIANFKRDYPALSIVRKDVDLKY